MKTILQIIGSAALCVCSVAYAQRTTYFSEDFSSRAIHRDYWDADSSKKFTNYLFFQNQASAGGETPEAVIGYYPDMGMSDVLNGTFRLVSKPFETKGGHAYVTLKYTYAANKRSLKNNRSFGILARQGDGEWTTCTLIDSLPAQIPASVLCARLPEAFEEAEDIQIAIQLYSTKDACLFYFVLDDVEFFSIPSDWYAAEVDILSSFNISRELDTLDMTLRNIGNRMDRTCTLSYSWDDGEVHSVAYELQEPLAVDAAVHVRLMPEGWDAAAYGAHKFDVWVSEIDGTAVAEAALRKQTYVFYNVDEAELFAKKILIEEFTSASCSPCAAWNSSVFNPTFDSLGLDVVLIKYQMNWPGTGDVYYRREGGARRNYYGVSGVPTMVVEGKQIEPASDMTRFLAYMRGRMEAAGKAFFNIVFDTLAIDSVSGRLTIAYKVETKGVWRNAKLHTAVLEGETTGNVGSNGERSFHHVLMAMTPGVGADGNTGLDIDLKADTVYEFHYTLNMKTTHMEEPDDLLVACFLQGGDGTIIQAAIKAVEVMAASGGNIANEKAGGYEPLAIYPNPASERVYLKGLEDATVEVYDLTGRLRSAHAGVNGEFVMDVRDYKPGLYVIRVREGRKVSAGRLNVVR